MLKIMSFPERNCDLPYQILNCYNSMNIDQIYIILSAFNTILFYDYIKCIIIGAETASMYVF